MAAWYVSSAAYAAITTFAVSTAYTVGQIVKPITPTADNRHAFRCTTAGTSAGSEPTWALNNNATTSTGTAVFTCVTGQSTYAWASAGGDIGTLTGSGSTSTRAAAGDQVFVSSDHSETYAGKTYFININNPWAGSAVAFISINRAGSVPPVAADITAGATCITSSSQPMYFDALGPIYVRGFSFQSASFLYFNNNRTQPWYFRDCAFWLNNASGASRLYANNVCKVTWDNSTVRFGDVAQGIGGGSPGFDLNWINTPSAVIGTPPTNLFAGVAGANSGTRVTCRGVDLSAVTTALLLTTTGGALLLFDSCRIAPGVIRARGTPTTSLDTLELVNTYDGTNILNERYVAAGVVTTDRTITLSGGATDDVGTFSHKMVSTTLIDRWVLPLEGFWLDIEQQAVGSSKTATVEIISSASLNNDDISLLLEYQGTAGSSLASLTSTLPSPVTAASAVTASTATWSGTLVGLWNSADSTNVTLSGGSLVATATAGGIVRCTIGPTTGKYYWEATLGTFANGSTGLGIASPAATSSVGATSGQAALHYPSGAIWINGSSTGSTLGARSSGNVIGFALDAAAQLIWFRVAPSGNWNGSGTANPATGTGGLSVSALGSSGMFPCFGPGTTGESVTANFGASGFTGTVPSGFTSGISIALITQKLVATFTPQVAGRVRGQVRLGKASTTAYYNPAITIT